MYATRIDALEAQINPLSSCFQALLEHFDGVARVVTSIGQSVENIAKSISVPSVTESIVKSAIVQPVTESARSLNPPGAEATFIPSPARLLMLASENVEPYLKTVNSESIDIPQSYSSSITDPGYSHLSSMKGSIQQLSSVIESEHTCISRVEGTVNQMALMMETFFAQHQLTPALPISDSSMLPGTIHPRHVRVSLQHE